MKAWFHCFAGIAGDMALASLLDAGADADEVRDILGRVDVPGWSLEVTTTMRSGLRATAVDVRVDDDHHSRPYGVIAQLLDGAPLPPRVQERAQHTFRVLAEAEGRLHGVAPAEVHFHEVGGHDAIVDVVGTCAALEVLDIDDVAASEVTVGSGSVTAVHGVLPNPAPAVVELLVGAPIRGCALDVELTTPTGAALLAALAGSFGPMPPMRVAAVGYGAGTRDLDGFPNVTQVVVGEAVAPVPAPEPGVLIETNVDDVTGETLAYTIEALRDAGASDAWVTPIVMKKGRPAHTVSAVAAAHAAADVEATLLRETGSLGLRRRPVAHLAAVSSVETATMKPETITEVPS